MPLAILGGIWSFATSKLGMWCMGAIALGLVAWRVHHVVYESGYTDGAAKVQTQFDAYRSAATQRQTNLALLWAAAISKVNTESLKRQEAEGERNDAFAQRAAALSRAPTIVISADAARLWGDITPVGNAPAKPAAPAVSQSGAKAISESALVGFVNAAKAAYDDAVGLFHDARDSLNACLSANRSSQPEGSP